jgi:GNAT superfamily N-acetyltransferase
VDNTVQDLKIRHEKRHGRDIKVFAFHGSRLVGEAIFSIYKHKRYNGKPYCFSVKVDPNFRRKGVATQMYLYAEKHYGEKLVPSVNQSEDSKALWSNPTRKFGVSIEAYMKPASFLEKIVKKLHRYS